ncbi:MAG TPA: hypothetical protein VHL11_06045, partial [Phototrophicaceae bacterium]|nr:hypothetical protein [Phototrophicaceae bacterium]
MSTPSYTLNDFREKILPLRSQMVVRNTWLKLRLETVIPQIMQREGFDLWLVIAREYNEDPVIMTLIPEPSMAARRRTILMFHRQPDGTVERLSVDRYGYGEFYTQAWNPDKEGQHECLARLIQERDPQVIGINFSDDFAFGDGLTFSEHQTLLNAIDPAYHKRIRSAERLCLGWLESRIEPELIVYPGLVEMGHALIDEAFS